MTRIIAIPIKHYDTDLKKKPIVFKSISFTAEYFGTTTETIRRALQEGNPIKGYFIDEEIGE